MDKLRRSFRSSFRKKDGDYKEEPEVTNNTRQWPGDEASVKTNTCSFEVKYLGTVEVFESRGMQVCEEAVKLLKSSKRRPIKGTLHISGDGLRVADSETKGLVLDQTIEKVSFCAPDRNFERGFSYICRDGTTRRWMCHGFLATKDTGERLSHAVGCAFAICLEKKQKRDKECAVMMQYDDNDNTFTRLGSFRQGSITDRLQDPQIFRPAELVPSPPPAEPVANPDAIARPRASDLMFQRQASFRGLGQLSGSSPFKRQSSLRLSELPSYLADRVTGSSSGGSATNLACSSPPVFTRGGVSQEQASRRGQIFSCPGGLGLPSNPATFSPIREDALELDPSPSGPLSLPANFCQSTSLTPSPHLASSRSPLPPVPETMSRSSTPGQTSIHSEPPNPWDHVPDQPRHVPDQPKHCSPLHILGQQPPSLPMDLWLNNQEMTSCGNNILQPEKSPLSKPTFPKKMTENSTSITRNSTNLSENSTTTKKHSASLSGNSTNLSSVLDDPFDAEWASLAMRDNKSLTMKDNKKPVRSTNPFNNKDKVKTFELQM